MQNAATCSKNLRAPGSSPEALVTMDNSDSDDDIIELQPMRSQEKGTEQTKAKAGLPKPTAKRPLSAIDSGDAETPVPQAKRPRILSGAGLNTGFEDPQHDENMMVNTDTEPRSHSQDLDTTGQTGRSADYSANNVQTPARAAATGKTLPPTPESVETEQHKHNNATPVVSGAVASEPVSQISEFVEWQDVVLVRWGRSISSIGNHGLWLIVWPVLGSWGVATCHWLVRAASIL